jgi:hypothetical protein
VPVREEFAGVIEDHDTVTEQDPSLLRVRGDDACGSVVFGGG